MIGEIDLYCEPYDFLGPLTRGEVPGDLTVRPRHGANWRTAGFGTLPAAEASLARLIMTARSDPAPPVVPVPVFLARGFRHRCYYTTAGSDLTRLADLAGRTVVTNSWFDTGNTWGRAALREAGVDLTEVDWLAAPLVAGAPLNLAGVDGRPPPAYLRAVEDGTRAIDLLCGGRADAALLPVAPLDDLRAGRVRRVLTDYERAEHDYYQRTGIVPIMHTVAVDRRLVDDDPTLPARLYRALTNSWVRWQDRALSRSGGPPWFARAFERMYEVFGADWDFHGLSCPANGAAIAALIDEMVAHGHLPAPIGWTDVYPPLTPAAGPST